MRLKKPIRSPCRPWHRKCTAPFEYSDIGACSFAIRKILVIFRGRYWPESEYFTAIEKKSDAKGVSTKGGLDSKLHAACDGHGRPLILLPSEGQMSDYKGAAQMLHAFPKAKTLLADKGYDADWFRDALAQRKNNGLHSVEGKSQGAYRARSDTPQKAP